MRSLRNSTSVCTGRVELNSIGFDNGHPAIRLPFSDSCSSPDLSPKRAWKYHVNDRRQMPPEIKTILVGDSGVGKTSIATRAADNAFQHNLSPTIGASAFSFDVDSATGPISFNLWDTAGQDTFRNIIPLYFRGAHAAIVVFDLTNKDSFDHLATWVDLVKEHTQPNIAIVIVGNKSDMSERCVSTDEAMSFTQSVGAAFYTETSAMTGQSVHEVFQDLAEMETLKSHREQAKVTLRLDEPTQQNQCC